MGAEFVHGGNAAIGALLRAARLRTQPVEVPMRWRRDARLVEVPDFWDGVARITEAVPKAFKGSFGDYLAGPEAGRFPDEERERETEGEQKERREPSLHVARGSPADDAASATRRSRTSRVRSSGRPSRRNVPSSCLREP